MKICFVCGSYPPIKCGVGDYTARLVETLKKLGQEIEVITYPFIKKWGFRNIFKIISKIKEIKPEIIHIQYPSTLYKKNLMINFLPWFLKIFYRKAKIFSTLHEFKNYGFFGRLRLLINISANQKNIVADPDEIRIIKKYLKNAKVYFIPIGANNLPCKFSRQEIEEKKSKLGIKKEDFVIGFFGFIQPKKGFEYLLEAFYNLRQINNDAKLLVLGDLKILGNYNKKYQKKVEDYQNEIKNKIAQNHLSSGIIFTGYLPEKELSLCFQLIDAAIFPFDDGCSPKRGTIIAAMSHNLPILTTHPSFFKNFYLIRPKNKNAILEAILKIISSPKLKEELKNASKEAYQKFTWESIAKKHLELYDL